MLTFVGLSHLQLTSFWDSDLFWIFIREFLKKSIIAATADLIQFLYFDILFRNLRHLSLEYQMLANQIFMRRWKYILIDLRIKFEGQKLKWINH